MLTCFKCKKGVADPETLFLHIKDVHKICGKNCTVQCMLCKKTFSNFSTFKTNVLRCFASMDDDIEDEDGRVDPASYVYAVEPEIDNFQTSMRDAALELSCMLSAKMNWPRKDVFTTINVVQNIFISVILSGMEKTFIPNVRPGKEDVVYNFIEVITSAIEDIKTESRLDSSLKKTDLIHPLLPCSIVNSQPLKKKKRRRELSYDTEVDGSSQLGCGKRMRQSEDSEDSSENEYSEDIEDNGDNDNREETEFEVDGEDRDEQVISIEKGIVIILPIEFQIKKFFELPNVFEKVKLHTFKIQKEAKLDHLIKGRLWKEKLKNYKPDQVVIPFHFYGDGAQINNPLGPHTKSGEQQFNYFSFPTIPSEYASRLENIFVAQMYPAKYHKNFTNEHIYNNIIDIFTKLAEDGISLNINGKNIQTFFVCCCFIGDNKEQNQRLGYVGCHSANYPCRYCKMFIADIRTSESSEQAIRRNRDNYDIDVATAKPSVTGINEYSIFNRIPFFHVTESSGVDLAHDLTEGTHHIIFKKTMQYFIKKGYFDLAYLNNKMRTMDFGEMENGNRPVDITLDRLTTKDKTLRMTASEMFFFAHHVTLIVGDRVPDEDVVWQLVLTAITFFDLCYLHSYDEDEIEALKIQCEILNRGLMDIFNVDLKHKSHLSTHYSELTLDFGPLRYLQTIRFEGKHKEMKSYAKNTNNRINLPYSMAKKMQYNFAFRLLKREGLEDRIHIPKYTKGRIQDKVYYEKLQPSNHLTEISRDECCFATHVVLNGIIFSLELWLPNFEDLKNKKVHEVIDIVMVQMNQISEMFAICKTYAVEFDDHFRSYRVKMESLQTDTTIINISEFLSQHLYPVKIHHIQNKFYFRCKNF